MISQFLIHVQQKKTHHLSPYFPAVCQGEKSDIIVKKVIADKEEIKMTLFASCGGA